MKKIKIRNIILVFIVFLAYSVLNLKLKENKLVVKALEAEKSFSSSNNLEDSWDEEGDFSYDLDKNFYKEIRNFLDKNNILGFGGELDFLYVMQDFREFSFYDLVLEFKKEYFKSFDLKKQNKTKQEYLNVLNEIKVNFIEPAKKFYEVWSKKNINKNLKYVMQLIKIFKKMEDLYKDNLSFFAVVKAINVLDCHLNSWDKNLKAKAEVLIKILADCKKWLKKHNISLFENKKGIFSLEVVFNNLNIYFSQKAFEITKNINEYYEQYVNVQKCDLCDLRYYLNEVKKIDQNTQLKNFNLTTPYYFNAIYSQGNDEDFIKNQDYNLKILEQLQNISYLKDSILIVGLEFNTDISNFIFKNNRIFKDLLKNLILEVEMFKDNLIHFPLESFVNVYNSFKRFLEIDYYNSFSFSSLELILNENFQLNLSKIKCFLEKLPLFISNRKKLLFEVTEKINNLYEYILNF